MTRRVGWCGFQHHFIGECRFHLATFVDGLLISTVGDYHPRSDPKNRETLGADSDSFFETFVFPTDNEWDNEFQHPVVTDWGELWGERRSNDVDANALHSAMVAKAMRGWKAKTAR